MGFNWKQIIFTVIVAIVGIYAVKWVNAKYHIPVVGEIVDAV